MNRPLWLASLVILVVVRTHLAAVLSNTAADDAGLALSLVRVGPTSASLALRLSRPIVADAADRCPSMSFVHAPRSLSLVRACPTSCHPRLYKPDASEVSHLRHWSSAVSSLYLLDRESRYWIDSARSGGANGGLLRRSRLEAGTARVRAQLVNC